MVRIKVAIFILSAGLRILVICRSFIFAFGCGMKGYALGVSLQNAFPGGGCGCLSFRRGTGRYRKELYATRGRRGDRTFLFRPRLLSFSNVRPANREQGCECG